MATRTVRFGLKDQVLIRWYMALKEQGNKDITSILALAIEYHEITGKYIEIARVKLSDVEYDAVIFNMYFAKNTFIYDWFINHHKGFQQAIRDVLNVSITRLPANYNGPELLATKSQLEQVLSTVRSASRHTLDSIDTIINKPPDIPVNTSAQLIPTNTQDKAVAVNTGDTAKVEKRTTKTAMSNTENIKKADKEIDSFLQFMHV